MRTHKLKILSIYAKAKLDGKKMFEIRFNDRNYKVKDKTYCITYLTAYEQKDGYIVFGDREV